MKQTVFDDYCIDHSINTNQALCPTNRALLHHAMNKDTEQLKEFKKLRDAYDREQLLRETIYQQPV